jgi:hypothetical protein
MKHLPNPLLTGLLAALLLAGTATTQAQTVPNGRLLASNCFQCHGTNGKGPGFDSLAGKSASSIYGDLKDFQSGKEATASWPSTPWATPMRNCRPCRSGCPPNAEPGATMQRRNFLAQASTLALSTGWLTACGGGGSTDTDTSGTSTGTPTAPTNPVVSIPPRHGTPSRA